MWPALLQPEFYLINWRSLPPTQAFFTSLGFSHFGLSIAVSIALYSLYSCHPSWPQTPQAASPQMPAELSTHSCPSSVIQAAPGLLLSTTWALSSHLPVSAFKVACSLSLWVVVFLRTLSSGHCHARLATSTPSQAFTAASTATHSQSPTTCKQL